MTCPCHHFANAQIRHDLARLSDPAVIDAIARDDRSRAKEPRRGRRSTPTFHRLGVPQWLAETFFAVRRFEADLNNRKEQIEAENARKKLEREA